MRISTAQFFSSSAANYSKNFSNIIKTQQEASDYVRIRTAADDPVGAARLLQLGQQSSMLAQYKTNTSQVQNTLGQSESVLKSVDSILQRASELALGSKNGGFSDNERKANADELGQLENQLLSLMNTRDENGKYLYSGSRSDTAPYSKNADGTYSYNGDQTTLSLQVGDSLTMATNDSGWSVFEQALNTSRTAVTKVPPTPGAAVDDKVALSNGQVSGSATYNAQFRSGEPYKITIIDSTHFSIKDSLGNDKTSEATNGGVYDSTTVGGTSITFRGVDMQLNFNLAKGEDPNTAIGADRVFQLASTPDSFSTTRSPGNASTSVVSDTQIVDVAKYNAAFPNGGAILKFTSPTTFELYASPITSTSKKVDGGTYDATNKTATAAGVQFTFTADPDNTDTFSTNVNTHQTQNILDTVANLRKALLTPANGDPVAEQKLNAALDSAIANLGSGKDQVLSTVTSIGARGAALDVQVKTNESLGIANADTQKTIADSDPAEVIARLTLQQTMLQASQLAFNKISQLGLFNKM